MEKQDYYKSELEEVTDFDEQTTAHSSPRQWKPFLGDQAEEDFFRDFDSDYDDVTINITPPNDFSLVILPSRFDVPQTKKRRVVISSSDTE